jgi:hypothetical protein
MEPTQGRWVCRRCFASNEADAAACAQCGLQRGAEPGAGDEQPWAAATPPAPARPMWMQLALRFWWVGLIVVVAAAGWYFSARRDETGQITTAGDVKVTDLRVGDCFDEKDPGAEEIEEVQAKPCTEPHELETFYVNTMPVGDYPGNAQVEEWVGGNCVPQFEQYVGTSVQVTTLDLAWYAPTVEGWNDGDRTVLCAVYDPNNAELTESLRNAAR